MELINAPVAGPAASAAYCDASLTQLEGCMAEAKALTAERLALGNTATDRKRKEDIATKLADLRSNLDAIRLCLDSPPLSGCSWAGSSHAPVGHAPCVIGDTRLI